MNQLSFVPTSLGCRAGMCPPYRAPFVDNTGFPKESRSFRWRRPAVLRATRQAGQLLDCGVVVGGHPPHDDTRPCPRSPRHAPCLAARTGNLHKRYLIHVAGFISAS